MSLCHFLEAIDKTSPVVDAVYVPIIHSGVVQANQNIPQHRTLLTKDIKIFMERYAFEFLLSCCLCRDMCHTVVILWNSHIM